MDQSSMLSAGFSLEDHEVIRQAGQIWFIDATGEESNADSIKDTSKTELWGGLYASGHLEIKEGILEVDKLIDAIRLGIEQEKIKTKLAQNQAGRMEVLLFSRGFRATIDTHYPLYSLHMDAELSHGFNTYRQLFDQITINVLNNLSDLCKAKGITLENNYDLDFSHTDSSKAYSILKSIGAEGIKDPLAIAIRDWHRSKGR
jgi:hypothetical protein